jgi:CHAT domain-containing protein
LECAAEEGEAIGNILGVHPLTGTEATKQAVTTCCSPEILHIATHGMLLPAQPSIADLGPVNPLVWRDPGELRLQLPGLAVLAQGLGRLSKRQLPEQALRSILVLAGVNTWLAGAPLPDEAGNGLITAEDIAAMDLVGNKLTVLSACETGLGVIGIGEGVLGLRSSFTMAGAETVVVSLWSVDDVSTRDLMCAFYQGLIKGTGRAVALHEAQTSIRKQYPDDPYYWAPFICQGAIEPLPR